MKKIVVVLLRKIAPLCLLSIIFAVSASAQNDCKNDCSCSISGRIIDVTTNEPVPYATIRVKDMGTLTNENGYFKLENLCDVEFDLAISHLGYKRVVHHHDIYHPDLVVKLAPDDMILESIVVEGELITTGLKSITASKLSGKTLEVNKGESLGDLLTNITGVSTLKTGQNVVKPIIHGLHSDRILIINNGVRHESQSWGDDHAPEIDASLAENITLVKGAATIKYGPDAMGGVIIIAPPKMELSTGHLHGEGGIMAASNGRSLHGDIFLQQGYKKFAWLAQASGLYQGDLKAPNYHLTNTGARETSYTFGTRYHKKNLDLSVYYSHVQQQLGILRGSVVGNIADLDRALKASEPFYTEDFSYDINNPNQQVKHNLVRIKGSYKLPKSLLNVKYGFQVNNRQEFDVRRGNNNESPAIDLELFTHTVDLDWQHESVHGWTGSIGGQWLYQDNNNLPGTNTIPFVPNYNISRFGIYVTESKQLGDVNFEAGIRYDYQYNDIRGRDSSNDIYRNSITYKHLTGLLGVTVPLGEKASLQSNIGTAWRPPNVAELYSFGKHGSVIDYGLWRHKTDAFGNATSSDEVLNQRLRPVKNEMGMKWVTTYNFTGEKHGLLLTGHINYMNNFIYSHPAGIVQDIRGPFPYYVYGQTDALFLGVDASYILRHGDLWQSEFKGSYIQASDVKNEDVFIGIPANKVSYELSYDARVFDIDRLEFSLNGTYMFRQYRDPRVITVAELQAANEQDTNIFNLDRSNFDFVAAPDGYLLINGRISATVNQLIFGLQVKNALNTAYRSYTNRMRYFADAPGINFLFSVRYKF